MNITSFSRLFLITALVHATAGANDGVAGVSTGGIVFRKTDAIAMKKEVLNVSARLISVDYEFLNESGADLEETIVFPLPAYSVNLQPVDSYYGQPNGFSIQVDGKPVDFTPRLVALLDERDVTARLRKAGLTDEQIAYNQTFGYGTTGQRKLAPPALSKAQINALVKDDLWGDVDSDMGPRWLVQVNYVWRQRFPANKIVRVQHAYRPFNSSGPGESYWDESIGKRYCADKAFLAARDKLIRRKGNDQLTVETLSYILKTGNTWKRGIEDFTLNIIKGRPDELVSLCFPGTFKKIDEKTYQVRLKNFQPVDNLNVYFGNVDGSGAGDKTGVMPRIRK